MPTATVAVASIGIPAAANFKIQGTNSKYQLPELPAFHVEQQCAITQAFALSACFISFAALCEKLCGPLREL
jgi:hypothetical protein